MPGTQLAGLLCAEDSFCCRIMEGSTINSDGKWPGGRCRLGGWGSWNVCMCVCVCVQGWKGGLTKELEEVEDSVCVKAALNYISNHQSACQQNRTRGLDISPTCTELAQHFTCKAFQHTHTNALTHAHTRTHSAQPSCLLRENMT